MISLKEINEKNWLEAGELRVSESQKKYVATPMNILARGYLYRKCNAQVYGIYKGKLIIGLVMVRDLDEEPACYDLQQFLIDARFQNKGFGTKALKQVLDILRDQHKYDCVEVCVDKSDTAAIHVYKKIGFMDAGYVSEDLPDFINLMYYFR